MEFNGKVEKLGRDDPFRFSCHPGVPCFTECCRELDLALTPYDVIRLRQTLKLGSAEFLGQFVLVERSKNNAFPQVFMAMEDDNQRACPFVSEAGCRVYPDRPGACRTYPVGRGVSLTDDGEVDAFHVLIREEHCRGFEEDQNMDLNQWAINQGIKEYNQSNDRLLGLLQHQRIKEGFRPSDAQQDRYLNVLYNLDALRQELVTQPRHPGLPDTLPPISSMTDAALLEPAIRILEYEFFG